jgi:hypothetical protein
LTTLEPTSAITTTYNLAHPLTPAGSFWQLSHGVIGPSGQAYSSGPLEINGAPIIPTACRTHLSLGAQGIIHCAIKHGYRGYITYQPASQYWTFQGIETGIFVFLAAALIAATAIVLLRRDA